MSAISRLGDWPIASDTMRFVELPPAWRGRSNSDHFIAKKVGDLFFMGDAKSPDIGFAFDGRVPDSCIDHYIGCHPGHLIDGFAAMPKPAGCMWMCRSRITSIVNYKGSVLVELEPAS